MTNLQKCCPECDGCYKCYCGLSFCNLQEYEQHRFESRVNMKMECA